MTTSIRHRFEMQLSELREDVLKMGSMVEEELHLAMDALEALARRSALVAQLRFAVTMQDLRTVVLLRRQLNQEQARRHPWLRLRPARSGSQRRPQTAGEGSRHLSLIHI